MITCPNCGRENADNFNFCLDCGTDLSAPPPQAAPPVSQEPVAVVPPTTGSQPVLAATPAPSAPVVTASIASAPVMAPPPAQDEPVALTERVVTPAPAVQEPVPLTQTTKPAVQAQPPIPLTQQTGTAPGTPIATPNPVASVQPAQAGSPTAPVVTPAASAQTSEGTACPSCGTNNAAGMKFCGNCGQRLDGAPATTLPPTPAAPAPAPGAGSTMFMHAADMSALAMPKARLITIDQQGREGMTFNLSAKQTQCGRTNGTILFFDDNFVSPTHCTFEFEQGHLTVVDHNSLNGVFLRVRGEWTLDDGDLIRIGRQLFRLDGDVLGGEKFIIPNQGDDAKIWGSPEVEAWARLVQVLETGKAGEVHLLKGEEVRIGREAGDIVLTNDGFVSASHCAFSAQGARIVLRDLGSSNGTYVRLREPKELHNDDFILIGNQMLRVELR